MGVWSPAPNETGGGHACSDAQKHGRNPHRKRIDVVFENNADERTRSCTEDDAAQGPQLLARAAGTARVEMCGGLSHVVRGGMSAPSRDAIRADSSTSSRAKASTCRSASACPTLDGAILRLRFMTLSSAARHRNHGTGPPSSGARALGGFGLRLPERHSTVQP